MAYPKLLTLSDHELTLEITNAVRHLHTTRHQFQYEREGLSDEAWDILYRKLLEAEKYLRFCLAERSRREAAATFKPKKPRRQRTLVKKQAMPAAPPSANSGEQGSFPEPKGDPVIVYEPHGPRRWRKGDPIY